MLKFLAMHELHEPKTPQEAMGIWTKYQTTAAKVGAIPVMVHVCLEKGVNFCITEADNAETVREAHEEGVARDSITGIYEIETFTPEDIK